MDDAPVGCDYKAAAFVDPAGWDEYRGELADWDVVAGDGLGSAKDEYPEYNQ